MSWSPNQWALVQGNEAKLVVHVLDHNGDPLNISGATTIKIGLKKADGTFFSKDAETGFSFGEPMDMLFVYGFTLTAVETALLPIGENQNIMIKVGFGDNVRSYLIKKSLSVRTVSL